ncbi:MAG: HU family DNA-binding protein [Candidatus Kapabacteria bacterium]|nr:HU family DNA-binding protein [Candidatus Kapabacteria bacterium]MCS7169605.1 HU family DNA-binding protein [Candidatus Kapabacteria bacterium]MDW7996685.1 HU family DNA-binding protein [Bacteroidota bacterium]MDW8225097.1 HU family DNA-binding protein [Bacteroidota bacterium]
MNKAGLVAAIAQKAGLSKAVAEKALKGVVDTVSEALAKGESVSLVGFGTFAVQQRSSRRGRNPRTGARITIPARKVPKFTPGKTLRDMVGGQKKMTKPAVRPGGKKK